MICGIELLSFQEETGSKNFLEDFFGGFEESRKQAKIHTEVRFDYCLFEKLKVAAVYSIYWLLEIQFLLLDI